MLRALAPLVMLISVVPTAARAVVGVPPTCAVRSAELKLARECFTGDMRADDDVARFVGLDESSPADLNYCFNAFVVPYPVQGARLSLLVLRDDELGRPIARNYAVSVAALAATLGHVPTNKRAQILTFKNMRAECYAKRAATDTCSKGLFGFGSTDLPFAIQLEGGPANYNVIGGVRDRALIEMPGTAAVDPTGVSPATQTLDYLAGQVKQRIVVRAKKDLASLLAKPTAETRDRLATAGEQFRYCRLAFDGLNHRLRRPDPFAEDEKKVLETFDARMIDPAGAPAAATAAAAPIAPKSPAPAPAAPIAPQATEPNVATAVPTEAPAEPSPEAPRAPASDAAIANPPTSTKPVTADPAAELSPPAADVAP